MASVKVLGRFKASSETGEQAKFRTLRAAELVAMLALQPNGRLRRTTIAQDLWPDSSPSEQLKNLRPALHYAKAAMGSEIVYADNDNSESLVLAARSDWQEAKVLDFRAASEEEPDTKLMQLFNLAEVVRKPFLELWDRDWIDQYRIRHAKLQFRVLHSLAEELALRGELATAAEYANQLAESDPFNESVVRLQIKLLGQSDQLAEAQELYIDFRNRFQEAFDLDVSPELKAIAQKAFAGGYAKQKGAFVPTVQLEMVQSLLTMLAEASPERLLPLFAAPEVNWAIVTNGREIRRILEAVIDKTSGWEPDRAGVVKRLLQYYHQEGEFQKLRNLSIKLLASPRKIDRIPALSYLAMIAVSENQKGQALDLFDQAEQIAANEANPYLLAVTRANQAMTHLAFADFDKARDGLESCLADLTQRTEPNARYATSRAMVALAQTYELLQQIDKAEEAIQSWFAMGLSDEAIRQDSTGLALLGMIRAGGQDRSALDLCGQALEQAVKSRRRAEMTETTLVVCRALVLLGHSDAAQEAARSLHAWIQENRGDLVPLERLLLKRIGLPDLDSSSQAPTSLPKIMFGLRDAIELQT